MQILYIIGNGFDLNLGLKTSYKDFYDSYKSENSDNENIALLKKNISNNYKNWSDLELALGHYTDELKSLEEFDTVFEDIGEKLAQYLMKEEENFEYEKVDSAKFLKELVIPENALLPADRLSIRSYKQKFSNTHWATEIFTFNYTRVIEKILGNDLKDIKITNPLYPNSKIQLRNVHHIHGYTDDRMVMGVNDISQLKNKSFHNNQDVLEAIIKEKCNKAYRHTIDNQLKAKINTASMICIFGSSIGDTDNMWWELIGERLKKDIPLIIFTKGEEVISPRIGYKNNRTERRMRNYFLKKTKLTKEEKEKVYNNIYVALDSSMFKNIYV
ncbi:Bacteriophage abortive infection AbiH [Salegentibacter echinorum]|uniref:Bacteriophage abortive infection AbiH n=1 Tax=Salegentibacter echinorum TaxID=1073325 RepID=A0A1M5IEK6_SALEC|nr:AbiH family protein [Salegentibacter echinorum]SHG26768.1 Bacteriophage abortive infection AbiH [Salegentibacter echinorum]